MGSASQGRILYRGDRASQVKCGGGALNRFFEKEKAAPAPRGESGISINPNYGNPVHARPPVKPFLAGAALGGPPVSRGAGRERSDIESSPFQQGAFSRSRRFYSLDAPPFEPLSLFASVFFSDLPSPFDSDFDSPFDSLFSFLALSLYSFER